MKVYFFDSDGWLVYEDEAFLDPIEQQPRVPSNGTLLVPPSTGENERARFVGGAWTTGEDPDYTRAQAEALAAQEEADAAALEAQKVAANNRFVVFYRDDENRDEKVLGGARWENCAPSWDAAEPVYKGLPLGDPSNEFVGYALFDSAPTDWNARNSKGVPLKRVVLGEIEDRTTQAVEVDSDNRQWLLYDADLQIKALLADKAETTHLMEAAYDTWVVMKAMMAHLGITDEQLDAALPGALTSKARLISRETELYVSIQQIRYNRDILIAGLES